jgi:hypothetical protein
MSRNPKIDKHPDYIVAKVYQNSLARLLERHPSGVSDDFAKKCLQVTKEELDRIHESALLKLKKHIK